MPTRKRVVALGGEGIRVEMLEPMGLGEDAQRLEAAVLEALAASAVR